MKGGSTVPRQGVEQQEQTMRRKADRPLFSLVLFLLDLILCLSPVSSLQSTEAASSFHSRRASHPNKQRPVVPCWTSPAAARRSKSTNGEDEDLASTSDPLTKASWYAVEAFGKIFGSGKLPSSAAAEMTTTTDYYSTAVPPASLTETLARLQADNEREYFLSGQVDELLYDPNCIFADPFVEFQGRDRFVENLANLGSFITEYSAKPISYRVYGNVVETKFMVKLRLNLPWQPVLAWPWGVRCEVNEQTNLGTLLLAEFPSQRVDGLRFRHSTHSCVPAFPSRPSQRVLGYRTLGGSQANIPKAHNKSKVRFLCH